MANFPSGSSGLGLLVLRLAVAATALVLGTERLAFALYTTVSPTAILYILFAAVGLLGGACLAVGFLNSHTTAIIVIVELGLLLVRLSDTGSGLNDGIAATPVCLFESALAVGLTLTGPGVYSVDARRYGRREIILPPPADAQACRDH